VNAVIAALKVSIKFLVIIVHFNPRVKVGLFVVL
jgi:hypothetical protein